MRALLSITNFSIARMSATERTGPLRFQFRASLGLLSPFPPPRPECILGEFFFVVFNP
jgi:hypothetical protein